MEADIDAVFSGILRKISDVFGASCGVMTVYETGATAESRPLSWLAYARPGDTLGLSHVASSTLTERVRSCSGVSQAFRPAFQPAPDGGLMQISYCVRSFVLHCSRSHTISLSLFFELAKPAPVIEYARLRREYEQLVHCSLEQYALRRRLEAHAPDYALIGTTDRFLSLLAEIDRLAALDHAPVLLTGERGSGKEAAALAIHHKSSRRAKPFVSVNCGALTPELCVSELFGCMRGAYTGAPVERLGKFRAAEGGTLFLDEITECPRSALSSMLRALDCGEIQVLGRDEPVRVDVRVICASNRNIEQLVQQGLFPADVHDRINVLHLHVPSLRERREDIPVLLDYHLRRCCRRCACDDGEGGLSVHRAALGPCCPPSLIQDITRYAWPGNIRELRNFALRIWADCGGHACPRRVSWPPGSPLRETAEAIGAGEDPRLVTVVQHHIEKVLNLNKGNKTATARMLGLPLSTLVSKMKRLKIDGQQPGVTMRSESGET